MSQLYQLSLTKSIFRQKKESIAQAWICEVIAPYGR